MTEAGLPGQDIPRDRLRTAREVLLTVGAIAGLVCLVLAFAALAFGIKPIVFRSGSMSPAIDTGALAISRSVNAGDLRVGDVVTVKTDEGTRVTHRITNITPIGDTATLVLKGDANEVVDQNAYQVAEADRVLFAIPRAGYVADALSGRLGTFAGGLLVGLVLVTAFGRRRHDIPAPEVVVDTVVRTVEVPAVRKRPLLAAGIGLAMVAMLVAATKQTGAYFNDAVSVNSGTFTMRAAVAPPAPVITGCTTATGNNPNRINWSYGTNPTTFEVRYTGNAHPAQSLPGNLRTSLLSQGLNNEVGSFTLVAIVSGVESAPSNLVNYSGNGNSKVCAVQP